MALSFENSGPSILIGFPKIHICNENWALLDGLISSIQLTLISLQSSQRFHFQDQLALITAYQKLVNIFFH
jgi:late competence protein required for DNA uptake (superfamily II DNA/RNA helicase)